MVDDAVAELRTRMALAVEAQDFERAAQFRDQLVKLTGGADPARAETMGPSKLRRQVPGQMGLGTDQQVYIPPPGWRPPAQPDLNTSVRKGRKRRV